MSINYDGEEEEEISKENTPVEAENNSADYWDDSELITAWNSAIDEYRQHHKERFKEMPLHENQKSFPKWTRVDSNATIQQDQVAIERTEEEDCGLLSDGIIRILEDKKLELQKGKGQSEAVASGKSRTTARHHPYSKPSTATKCATAERTETTTNSFTHVPPLPPSLPMPGDDVHLHQLLHSWYNAGYYTGLYQKVHNSNNNN